jgi:hypothetical protein
MGVEGVEHPHQFQEKVSRDLREDSQIKSFSRISI